MLLNTHLWSEFWVALTRMKKENLTNLKKRCAACGCWNGNAKAPWPHQFYMRGMNATSAPPAHSLRSSCVTRWAIGGRWLQSPASQDGDGGKPDFGEGHFWPCYRDWIVAIFACEQVLDIANPWYSNGRSSRDSLASQDTRIFQREAGDSIERGEWLTTKYF